MDESTFEDYLRRIDAEDNEDAKEDLANEMMSLLSDENTQITSASSVKDGTVDYLVQMAESVARAKVQLDNSDAFVMFVKSEGTEDPDTITWKSFIAGASVEDYLSLVLCCKTMLELLADTLRLAEEDDDAIT